MENKIYIDEDNDKILTEVEIRKLDFEENLGDLNNNKDDIFMGFINIESVTSCIENSLNAKIEDVIDDLNKCWGYNISIYYKKNQRKF